MEQWVSIGKASKTLGVSISTLRVWEKKGILIPDRTPTGHRRYKLSQLKSLELKKHQRVNSIPAYIYARVSTQKQANAGNLDKQIGRLTEYAIQNKHSVSHVFKDIASGLNETRRGLQKLLHTIRENNGGLVIIEYKDRLARFGYAYLEQYILDFGGQICVVEEKNIDEQQELVQDLIAIITSFSARIYGKRGGRIAKKLTDTIKQQQEVNTVANNRDGHNPGTGP
jgi:putative resolvase